MVQFHSKIPLGKWFLFWSLGPPWVPTGVKSTSVTLKSVNVADIALEVNSFIPSNKYLYHMLMKFEENLFFQS